MPKSLLPPAGFAVSTPRTACGRTRPSSNATRTVGQCRFSQSLSSSTRRPSTLLHLCSQPLANRPTTSCPVPRSLPSSTMLTLSFAQSSPCHPQRPPQLSAKSVRRPLPGSRWHELVRHCIASSSMVLLASLIFGPSRHRGPTLASADFYRFISAPFDANSSLQIDRSPRVLRTHLHAYVRRIYALAFWTSIRLGISSPAHPTRSPSAVRLK